jgi:hypothetical protein
MKTRFIKLLSVVLVITCVVSISPIIAVASESSVVEPNNLRFSEDGKFKIMVMTDPQDYVVPGVKPNMDPRTIILMEAAIDAEKPDLVVITGDLYSTDMNAEGFVECMNQMLAPMEERKVPWMIVFGNHCEDQETAMEEAGWDKIKQLEYFMSFEYNVNRPSMSGAEGYYANKFNTFAVGDMYHLIFDNAGEKPLYNIWGLDTNMYTRFMPEIAARGIPDYDWIRPEQLFWYYTTANQLSEKYGHLNAVMFLHIPLPEFYMMYEKLGRYGVVGSRYWDEFGTAVNSGLFATAQLAGDVRGIFAGHAHHNDYVGDYYGITLGFLASMGYNSYGPDLFPGMMRYLDLKDLLRGVRIIELDQNDLETINTRMVYATDLGVNCNTAELGNILRQYGQFVVALQEKAGVTKTGWEQNEDGGTIYINPAGDIQTGWHTIAGTSTYYFGDDGVMRTGWQTIGKNRYFFDDKGILTMDGNR